MSTDADVKQGEQAGALETGDARPSAEGNGLDERQEEAESPQNQDLASSLISELESIGQLLKGYELNSNGTIRILPDLTKNLRNLFSLTDKEAVEYFLGSVRNSMAGTLAIAQEVVSYQPGQVPERLQKSLHSRISALVDQTIVAVDALSRQASPGWTESQQSLVSNSGLELAAIQARLEASDELAGVVEEARKHREEIRETADDVREAAGDVGASSLSSHFAQYAHSERLTAEVLRIAASIILLAVAVGAAVVIFRGGEKFSAAEQLAKLTITIPLALLAAYLARESGNHRQAARWAQQLAVQLKTIRAYVADLPPDESDRVRTEFAKRIFGEITGGPGAGLIDKDTLDTLQRVTDMIKAINSPSPTVKAEVAKEPSQPSGEKKQD